MTYTFQYYYSTGHGGAVGSVDVDLKENHIKMLEPLMQKGTRELTFSEEIAPLYFRVRDAIISKELEGFDPDYLLEGFAEEDDDDLEQCMSYYLDACNMDIFMPGVEWDS